MSTTKDRIMTRARRSLPSRGDHWYDWRREEVPTRAISGAAIGAAVIGLAVAAAVFYGPDMIRYLKIRRM